MGSYCQNLDNQDLYIGEEQHPRQCIATETISVRSNSLNKATLCKLNETVVATGIQLELNTDESVPSGGDTLIHVGVATGGNGASASVEIQSHTYTYDDSFLSLAFLVPSDENNSDAFERGSPLIQQDGHIP